MAEEFDYPEPDALDERWFVVDSEKWTEVVSLLERTPEPKPRLADLLRERGMFASQRATGCHCGSPETASQIPGRIIVHRPLGCRTEAANPPAAHDCSMCEDCLHNGHKCCGCYDGACCQEVCQ